MPNIDDHMDDLFRNAADNYPLKTDTGNFEDLLPFVAGQAAVKVAGKASIGKRKSWALLLACLIIGGSTLTYFIYNNNKGNSKTTSASPQKNNREQKVVPSQTNTSSQLNTTTPLPTTEITKANKAKQPEDFYLPKKQKQNTQAKFSVNIIGGMAMSVADEDEKSTGSEDLTTKTKTVYDDHQQIKITVAKPGTATDELEKSIVTAEMSSNKKTTKPDNKKETAVTEITTTKPDKKIKLKPDFYYGLTAGAELNQVKGQGVTKTSLNGGVVLGLQLSKKISVETGMQLTQKKYYSSGEYFHPKTSDMPGNMKVMSLHGTSTLVEIPVGVKYNFSKKQNGFYGKAGVSTYLITKESNEYKVMVGGVPQDINSTYKDKHVYGAAHLNLGSGYQHGLGKKLNIRVEPYIRIPLKGIGIGSLPVTSTGLQLVLTRNIMKKHTH